MSLNYASLPHVLSQPISLFNSPRLDRRLDDDLITSARRADVSLLARPTHACTCYYKFPGNQGRGQPVCYCVTNVWARGFQFSVSSSRFERTSSTCNSPIDKSDSIFYAMFIYKIVNRNFLIS